MTWRERRLITILSTILLILVAAVLVVLGIRYRESRAAAEEGGMIDPSTNTVVDHNAYTGLFY